jgi:transposase
MGKHKSEDYKISAVKYYLDSNKTQEEICEIFKCSVRSLMRWVERYENDGEIKRYDKEPIAYKVHKKHVKFILEEISKNKMITMDELYLKIKNKFDNFELSKMHIHRIINDNNITLYCKKCRKDDMENLSNKKCINCNITSGWIDGKYCSSCYATLFPNTKRSNQYLFKQSQIRKL